MVARGKARPMHPCRKHLALALFIFASTPGQTIYAEPTCPGGGASGTITVTEKKLDSSQVSNASVLKAEQRCTLSKDKSADEWELNLIAHLSRAIGAEEVNIVFYDQASGKPETPGNEVNSFSIRTKKDTKIVIATLEINPDGGFKVGGKYSIVITRLVNGREEVYAKTTLQLK